MKYSSTTLSNSIYEGKKNMGRRDRSAGKIVKNITNARTSTNNNDNFSINSINKMKTQTSMNNTLNIEYRLSNYTSSYYKDKQCNRSRSRSIDKYQLKSQQFLENYQQKLRRYEKNKKQVLRDISHINQSPNNKIGKKQTLIPWKLKYSIKSSTIKGRIQTTQIQDQEIQQQMHSSLHYQSQMKPHVEGNLKRRIQTGNRQQTQHNRFIAQMDTQIRIQNKLRKIKQKLNPQHKKYIKQYIFRHKLSAYDIDRLITLSFQEFQFPTNQLKQNQKLNQNISVQTIGDMLIQIYQLCQHNWKSNIKRSFSCQFIKSLFDGLNYNKISQINLKVFTREFNILFTRNYQPREMFSIYQRLKPLNKSNFLYIFSS